MQMAVLMSRQFPGDFSDVSLIHVHCTWKEVSVVMCDRKMHVEFKDKVFKAIMRPAMTYGSECWAVKKKDENKLNSAEIRMLVWARGKTMLDHIRNEDITREAHVKPVKTFLEKKY